MLAKSLVWEKFIVWLSANVPWATMPRYIVGVSFVHLIYSLLLLLVFHALKIGLPSPTAEPIQIFDPYFPVIIIIVIIAEEFLFRAPLICLVASGLSVGYIIIGALLFSAVFGWYHGGVSNIFIQGVGGFIYCLLFLKCGGLQRKFWKAILSSTSAHMLFDGFLVGLIVLTGGTTL